MPQPLVDRLALTVEQQRILAHQRREDALRALAQEERPEAHPARRRDGAHEDAPPQRVAVVQDGAPQRPPGGGAEAVGVAGDADPVEPRQRLDLRPRQRQGVAAVGVQLLLPGDVGVEHRQELPCEVGPAAAGAQRPRAGGQLPHDVAQLRRRLAGAVAGLAAGQPAGVVLELVPEAGPAADHPRPLRVPLPQHRLRLDAGRDVRRRDRAGEELEQPVPLGLEQQQVEQHQRRPAHRGVTQRPPGGPIDRRPGPAQGGRDRVVGGVVEAVQDRDLVEGDVVVVRQGQHAARDLLRLGLPAGGAEVGALRDRDGRVASRRRWIRRTGVPQLRCQVLGELQRRAVRVPHQHDVQVAHGRRPQQQLQLHDRHVVDARHDQRAAAQRRRVGVVGQQRVEGVLVQAGAIEEARHLRLVAAVDGGQLVQLGVVVGTQRAGEGVAREVRLAQVRHRRGHRLGDARDTRLQAAQRPLGRELLQDAVDEQRVGAVGQRLPRGARPPVAYGRGEVDGREESDVGRRAQVRRQPPPQRQPLQVRAHQQVDARHRAGPGGAD